MQNFIGIHHSSVIVNDTTRALEFYCDVLGMQQSPRAELPYAGAWLAIGEQQIHLMELPDPDVAAERPPHGGRDRHIAVSVYDLSTIIADLEKAGISFTSSRSGRPAIFCRDPDGNALEIIETLKT